MLTFLVVIWQSYCIFTKNKINSSIPQ
jgi:hypothetical protein